MATDDTRTCAASVMDTSHTVMRLVRQEMRRRDDVEFTLQQFRAMKTIMRHNGVSLSHLSDHVEATLSATSKLIDVLVGREYVSRETAKDDRRRLILTLTEAGERTMMAAESRAVSYLADRLEPLTPGECAVVNVAMELLRSAFARSRPINSESVLPPPSRFGDREGSKPAREPQ